MAFRISAVLTVLLSACTMANPQVAEAPAEAVIDTPPALVVSAEQKRAYRLMVNLLLNHHYHKLTIGQISADIHDDFLDALDPARIYFLQGDIDEFEPHRGRLINSTQNGDLSNIIEMYNRYYQRSMALDRWTIARLKKPFDFKSKETVNLDVFRKNRMTRPWPESEREAQSRQEKRLQDQMIRLMLAGRSEEKARETLIKRYESALKRNNQFTMNDLFDVYTNVFTERFDPHSNYLSPKNSENFDIHMKLELEGIGAVLSSKDEKITIRELTPGGPAFKSGQLKIKDQILGVAQGKDGEMVDIVGWRLDKAVELIRGKKGTLVRLLVEPANGTAPPREIILERDTIALEEQAASAHVETLEQNGRTLRIGVIDLPSFYLDVTGASSGKKDYRSTSRDVQKLVEELKEKQVDGIILDLRNNGGGSLYEAVQTVGLFIDEGPVVQVSYANGSVRDEVDEHKGKIYDGPLAVIINHGSASASEIFAGAIQDYGRGLIIGNSSYGKGTVQTVMDLNRFVPDNQPPLGEVKFTIAMFHRVTGSSTQLKGVVPDVKLAEVVDLEDVGEVSEKHALPWKQIPATQFKADQAINDQWREILNGKQTLRARENPVFSRYRSYAGKAVERGNHTEWSLNLDERRAEFDAWKAYKDDYESAQRDAIPDLQSDAKRRKDVETFNQFVDEEEDKETFVPDVELYEALHVVGDYLELMNPVAAKPAA
ncbi:MAG: carboxy terminal-processing peptidase [Cardiobacteriaceae bacterium]|nr:carboxy terminal-processing peptidase [Cardiobacteriaceae bacterium]